jgi:hypothetical protein
MSEENTNALSTIDDRTKELFNGLLQVPTLFIQTEIKKTKKQLATGQYDNRDLYVILIDFAIDKEHLLNETTKTLTEIKDAKDFVIYLRFSDTMESYLIPHVFTSGKMHIPSFMTWLNTVYNGDVKPIHKDVRNRYIRQIMELLEYCEWLPSNRSLIYKVIE